MDFLALHTFSILSTLKTRRRKHTRNLEMAPTAWTTINFARFPSAENVVSLRPRRPLLASPWRTASSREVTTSSQTRLSWNQRRPWNPRKQHYERPLDCSGCGRWHFRDYLHLCWAIKVQCFSCGNFGHYARACTNIHKDRNPHLLQIPQSHQTDPHSKRIIIETENKISLKSSKS